MKQFLANNETAKKELDWIKWLQAIGIVLVVLGHSLPEDILKNNSFVIILIRNFIYSFHMPLFFTISGFLFCYSTSSKNRSYFQLIKNKAEKLLVPYVLLGLLAYIPHYLLSKFANRKMLLTPLEIIYSFLYPHLHSIRFFWFLPVLFIFFLVSPALMIFLKNKKYSILGIYFLIILSVFRPLNIKILGLDIVENYLIHFFIGMNLLTYQDQLKKFLENKFFILISIAVFSVCYLLFWYMPINNLVVKKLLELIIGLSGVVSIWCVSLILNKPKAAISILSNYSYQIFLLSIFPQVFFKILYQIGVLNYSFTLILMILSGICIPISISVVLKRYLPQLGWIIALK